MTKTITISLTEDLYKDFQKVKSQFNVSKVCQDAIGLKVARHRIAQDGDLIDFLKAGKMSAMDDSEAIGRKEAQHWIKNKCISFNDFLGVSKITGQIDEWTYDIIGTYLEDIGPTDILDESRSLALNEGKVFDVDVFAKGFLKELIDFWDEIKEKV